MLLVEVEEPWKVNDPFGNLPWGAWKPSAGGIEKRRHRFFTFLRHNGAMSTFDPSPYSSFAHMSSGQWYIPGSKELRQIADRAAELGHEYNQLGPTNSERSREIITMWINPDSGSCTVKAPAIIEYGLNTTIGEGVFINFGLTILDICPVSIGARTMIGPNCQLLTAGHPVDDVDMRAAGWENGAPIAIGEDVWFGGSVIVLGGVSIGDRAVVGAGAVVTKDIPADAIAVGNPAKVVRMRDKTRYERDQLDEVALTATLGN